jgi:hypothetical protein
MGKFLKLSLISIAFELIIFSLTCANVLSYGQGPCGGDYSCYSGLTCDSSTATCLCSVYTPDWNSISCDFKYMGCYYYNSTVSEFSSSQMYINSNTGNPIELLDCLQLCQQYGTRYAHQLYFNSRYQCACSSTYNNVSLRLSDNFCNFPW